MAVVADRTGGFPEFVMGSQARMIRLAELLTGERARAEALAQRAYARAYGVWGRVPDGDPEAYVRRCIVRGHRGWRPAARARRRARDARAGGAAMVTGHGGPSGPAGAVRRPAGPAGRREEVLRALDRLTARERLVVVLRCYLGLTGFQTAFELRTSPGTVSAILDRALVKLCGEPPHPAGAPG